MPKLVRESKESIESERVLNEFRVNLADARRRGVSLSIGNTRDELLRINENVTKKRMDIPGADAIVEYIEEVLIAGLEGYVTFKS
jgi:hypothetical protein